MKLRQYIQLKYCVVYMKVRNWVRSTRLLSDHRHYQLRSPRIFEPDFQVPRLSKNLYNLRLNQTPQTQFMSNPPAVIGLVQDIHNCWGCVVSFVAIWINFIGSACPSDGWTLTRQTSTKHLLCSLWEAEDITPPNWWA